MDAGRLRRETGAIVPESISFTAMPIFKINSTPAPLALLLFSATIQIVIFKF
jgi:hypothetical protein